MDFFSQQYGYLKGANVRIMKLTVVIPCYNEKNNIPLVLERFAEVIGKRDIEVIIVDNGSTDGSDNVIKELVPQYSFAKTIRIDINQGYGYGILHGLEAASGDVIGWTHADMQTDPKDVVRVYKIYSKLGTTNAYIKGTRKGRPFSDNVFTVGMSLFESAYFRAPLYDINAQPNFFPRWFYKKWENPPYDFALEVYALYMSHKEKLRVVRFPVRFPERIYGKSSWNNGLTAKIKMIKRTISFSREMKLYK